MGKQFILIISIIIIIGTMGISQLSADRGEVRLEYKLKPGEQFIKKINLAFKIAGESTGESQFTILCPVNSIVSDISADGLIEVFALYSPQVTDAIRDKMDEREELQQTMSLLEIEEMSMRKDGSVVELTSELNIDETPLAFKEYFELIGILPPKTVRAGDTWEQKINDPLVGQMEVKSTLVDFETVKGYDCAKLEGEITGKMLGPDGADMKIKEGKYAAAFAIPEGMMITEKIALKAAMVVPDEEDISFQVTYTAALEKQEMLKPEQFEGLDGVLKRLREAKDAVARGDDLEASRALRILSEEYPNSPLRPHIRKLMAKAGQQRQEAPTINLRREIIPFEQAKERGYITEWLILGPILGARDAATAINADFLESMGGEANVRPSPGDTLDYEGETLTWQVSEIPPSPNSIGQLEGFDVDNAAAYLISYLKFEEPGEVDLFLGSDDSIAAWMNGEEIWRNPVGRPWTPIGLKYGWQRAGMR